MICLIFASASELALIGFIASACKIKYENKKSRESKNHTERSNWSFLKEARYRNPNKSQQP